MANLSPRKLSPAEHDALEALVRSGTVEARLARRARTVLFLDAGHSVRTTAEHVGLAPRMVQYWKRRFAERGIAGLDDAPRSGRPKVIPLRKEARILAETQRRPPGPVTQWSSRTMAARHGVSQSFVSRLWRRHGLKPHRVDAYVASPDPDFEAKAAVILGLYLNPPAHAVVLCVDEKSHIQALDRTQPVLPLRQCSHSKCRSRTRSSVSRPEGLRSTLDCSSLEILEGSSAISPLRPKQADDLSHGQPWVRDLDLLLRLAVCVRQEDRHRLDTSSGVLLRIERHRPQRQPYLVSVGPDGLHEFRLGQRLPDRRRHPFRATTSATNPLRRLTLRLPLLGNLLLPAPEFLVTLLEPMLLRVGGRNGDSSSSSGLS
jgi:transposase